MRADSALNFTAQEMKQANRVEVDAVAEGFGATGLGLKFSGIQFVERLWIGNFDCYRFMGLLVAFS